GRSFYAQIRAPFELYALARLLRPAHVVETGVSSGVSSAHFLLALSENRYGRLHSIDLPVHQEGPVLRPGESEVSLPPERSPGWAVPAELAKGWDLRIGPAQKLLPRLLRELPKVDLFLHDDLHTPAHLTFELETLRAKLAPGAVALADNTRWTGTAFDRFARSLGVPVRRRRRSDLVGLRVEAVPGGTGPRSAARRRPALRRTF
ncbi:MAG TPA: class I SAM-dependent methyltransferase, partial [Thermoplasmata archaeon]|nr:class I SAM-dependent methyltransferase [Thermoplasmata archaeon]